MYQAAQLDMPYLSDLPMREKSKVSKLWDHLAEVKAIVREKGMIVPQHMVADLFGVSKQRVAGMIDQGHLDVIEIGGVRYVTESSLVAYASAERSKGGRPRKSLDSRSLWKTSVAAAQDILKKTSESR
jgi:hypothetical protein